MADERRPVFLAPHYDDVALSCGGTVAALADEGERPLIVTLFGGPPSGKLSAFARDMHRRWGVDADDALAARRREEACAADRLGAEPHWLDFSDAIYRGERYTSDPELFGDIHSSERVLPAALGRALLSFLRARGIAADPIYVPLAVGNHVDHQHGRELGRRLAGDGYEVLAYEDYPYAGDPGGLEQVRRCVESRGSGQSLTRILTEEQLQRRIDAVHCYASQLAVIFRHQGDPAASTEHWALLRGRGRPAERFWPLRG
ncbi:MAG TPA: PIG-L family deacetylase [Thermomicrobiaceae bacterium]|nr:PIG-L family deacetylase [Thermomicrobiaceae bacterium]